MQEFTSQWVFDAARFESQNENPGLNLCDCSKLNRLPLLLILF
jgi:hypothetical protein